jgi:F-type H+-transporting ATPase subunit delta
VEEIARVYATALFEAAKGRGKLDAIRDQLGQFVGVLEENREVRLFFFSPYFSSAEKVDGLKKSVSDVEPELLNFLELLLDPEIARRIGSQIEEQTGNKVELESRIDPDILGGLVLQVGNMVLDTSIRNRLEKLRKSVARAA